MYQTWEPTHEYPELRELVKRGYEIFDDSWNTYIPEHKKTLCDKIVRFYYFNQIGCETPDRFIHYINEQLSRIMPYYNQLYKSELIEINPLLNHSITQNGRSIENMLKAIKTDTTKTGKALRDFINDGTAYTDATAKTNVQTKDTLDKTTEQVYNKTGTDDATTDTTETQTYQEKVHTVTDESKQRDIKEVMREDTTGNKTVDGTETLDGTVTGSENVSKNTSINETGKVTDTGTVQDAGTGSSTSEGKKEWTETRDDLATTKVTNELNETTNTSSRQDVADTPQIRLGATGTSELGPQDQNWSVRSDYLSQVTWNTGSDTHTLHSTTNTNYKDDETKTHTETTSDNTNTTDNNTKTTNMAKDSTTDTITQHVETNGTETKTDNTTTTESNEDTTSNTDRTTTTDDDLTGKTTTDTDTTGSKTTTGHETYDDDWKEDGTHNTVEKALETGTKDSVANSVGKQTSSNRENESHETAQSSVGSEDTTRTTDTGTTDITTGFMNVSASALLEAFRKTFLNIDQKIIEDVGENFLHIF